jgi:dephospho-CoA kinase
VPPPVVGLTGVIAAGKSEALAAFARLGAATISTDAVVHELLEEPRVRDVLVERWGDEIAPGGELDRGRVGAIVFEEPQELAWLEALLHPLVGERVASWSAGLDDDVPLGVVEVPLLFETGMEAAFDATVCVVADDEVRRARAGARGTELLGGRSERQLSQDEKAERATYVIPNDSDLDELERRLAELMAKLRKQ